MRKIAFITLIILAGFSSFSQETDPLVNSKKLGLVSYLTYVKAIGEYKMISLVSDNQYKDEKFKERIISFHSAYNMLRLSVEKLINQLSADLLVSNRLKLYKQMNSYIKAGTRLPSGYTGYEDLIKEIDGALEILQIKTYKSTQGGFSLVDITGVVELVHGIITDARDAREKKVASLTGILKDLKLVKLGDLVKPEEGDKKESDAKSK